ncbi:hypothetical protein [Anaerorhabdus sp.]|uniref:hypothetical protein n=1 Tax=Anaerorhabdus sp. TaxID=1872524 RepID=UPI002FCB3F38
MKNLIKKSMIITMMGFIILSNSSNLFITAFASEQTPPMGIEEIENNDQSVQTRSVIRTVYERLVFVLVNYPAMYNAINTWITNYGTKLNFGQIYDVVMHYINDGEWMY